MCKKFTVFLNDISDEKSRKQPLKNLLKSATCMDVKSFLHKKICFVFTADDKPEMTMPKQINVKVTKQQNKHGHGSTRKCPIIDAGTATKVLNQDHIFIYICQERSAIVPLLYFDKFYDYS